MQRGVSPRIVRAQIVGTRGTTEVTGSQLRFKLGLYDTWAYFIAITTGQDGQPAPDPAPKDTPPADPNGGTPPVIARASWMRRIVGPRQLILTGRVSPKPERVTVQKLEAGRWKTLGVGRTDERGRYSMLMPATGSYRVLANGAVGPATQIR
jgi:stage II sporulation protein D